MHPTTDAALTRREALQHLALFPMLLSVRGIQRPVEETLHLCAAGITACGYLAKGQHSDMELAFSAISSYLPPLKAIVKESSAHRKAAARILAQALLFKATLSLHKEGAGRAIHSAQQADLYSAQSGDLALRLIILHRLAWIYNSNRQPQQALETALLAQSLLETALKQAKVPLHPSVQSAVYGAVAKSQAHYGVETGALSSALTVFDPAEDDESDKALIEFNRATLIQDEGTTYYNLGDYDKALSTWSQIIDPETLTLQTFVDSERTRIQIIGLQLLASLKHPQKDMERSIHLWKAGMEGAKGIRSAQQFREIAMAYDIMEAFWSGDARIKELRELIVHW